MKLLTSAIALDILGETHTFPTDIWMDGSIQKKTLHGSLYLRGTGDPTLLEEDFAALAKQVKRPEYIPFAGSLRQMTLGLMTRDTPLTCLGVMRINITGHKFLLSRLHRIKIMMQGP